MKKLNLEVHFCTQCRQKVENVENLLVVEDFYSRPFCSEDCILEFYTPMISELETQERNLRRELNVRETVDVKSLKNDKNLINDLITKPHEVLNFTNGMGEEFYILFKKLNFQGKDIYSFGVAFYHDENVSMMLFHSVTTSVNLVKAFQIGKAVEEEVNDENVIEDYKVDSKILEELEQKKSAILSELLIHRKQSDIPFENFPYYERFTKQTLHDPDEVYEYIDQNNEPMLAYIKAFQSNKIFEGGADSFYHIVLAIKVEEDQDSDQDILLPVLAFPSNDSNLYQRYKSGERLSGNLKN